MKKSKLYLKICLYTAITYCVVLVSSMIFGAIFDVSQLNKYIVYFLVFIWAFVPFLLINFLGMSEWYKIEERRES